MQAEYLLIESIHAFVIKSQEIESLFQAILLDKGNRREKNRLWTLRPFKRGDDVEPGNLDVHFPLADVHRGVTFPSEDDNRPA